jgi:predicted RNase H-like nuclease (RuvC/YqgF family)
MAKAKKLTAAKILGGKVDVSGVTAEELAEFIKTETLDVAVVEGTPVPDILNAICDALEARKEDADNTPPEAAEPGVEQSSYLKRRAKAIAAGRSELNSIQSNLEEESKKSSYIARRFKKMNPKR